MTEVPELFEIPSFLSAAECTAFIAKSEAIGYEMAKVNAGSSQRIVNEIRNNERVLYSDQALAASLWLQLKAHTPSQIGMSKAIGLNELFRFYKYQAGQKFRRHRDESYQRNESEFSYYTFMIYLNDGFEGGTTTFHNQAVEPEQGKALVFAHQLEHEGSEVTQGIKYVLRSDIMYRLAD